MYLGYYRKKTIKIRSEIEQYMEQMGLDNDVEHLEISYQKEIDNIYVVIYEDLEKSGMIYWVDGELRGSNIAHTRLGNMNHCSLYQSNDSIRGSKIVIVWGNGEFISGYVLEQEGRRVICEKEVEKGIFVDVYEFPFEKEYHSLPMVYLHEEQRTE